jgi:hypothetical protein
MDTFIPIDIDKVQRVLVTERSASHWVRWTEPESQVLACPLTTVLALGSTAPAP